MCFNRPSTRCPKIIINSTMAQLSVTDNVESSCDQCLPSALKVFLPEQQQLFVTKTETRRCLLATLTVCDINILGVISNGWGTYTAHESWALQCGGGEVEYGCGHGGRAISVPRP